MAEPPKVESPRRARRRRRLQILLGEFGGAAQVARETGTPRTHISAMLAGKRGLGDELAAKLEATYNKPSGWFATDGGNLAATIGPLDGAGTGRAAQATVRQAVLALGLALESVDQITRDQAAPLLLALTKEPKRAEEFAGRLEVTLKSGNGGPGESGQRTGTHG